MKMFYVSGGTVKQANKRFNTTGHDYEITIRNDSEVFNYLITLLIVIFHLTILFFYSLLDKYFPSSNFSSDVLGITMFGS